MISFIFGYIYNETDSISSFFSKKTISVSDIDENVDFFSKNLTIDSQNIEIPPNFSCSTNREEEFISEASPEILAHDCLTDCESEQQVINAWPAVWSAQIWQV